MIHNLTLQFFWGVQPKVSIWTNLDDPIDHEVTVETKPQQTIQMTTSQDSRGPENHVPLQSFYLYGIAKWHDTTLHVNKHFKELINWLEEIRLKNNQG